MTTLTLTTADPHDTINRVMAIFRLMDLPFERMTLEPGGDGYRVAITIAADEGLADALAARFTRLVSIEALTVERGRPLRAAAA
jgi:hypothetical protein